MHQPRPVKVVDYDGGGYDYRQYWQGRAYEARSEAHALRGVLTKMAPTQWLIDLGGGFGRNVPLYLPTAATAVLVDYSARNLQAALELNRQAVEAGRLHLIRSDLHHLPFADLAFDRGLLVRVLHHLPVTGPALAEMARVIRVDWILDVPIKHHLLARVRGTRGGASSLRSLEATIVGTTDEPFVNFSLRAVRLQLEALGWQSDVVASVNNFRRWDQRLPSRVVGGLSPLVHRMEVIAQRVGRGWWGPSQLLRARRAASVPAPASPLDGGAAATPAGWSHLAARMVCPACRGNLVWTALAAACPRCGQRFPRQDGHWDFRRRDGSEHARTPAPAG